MLGQSFNDHGVFINSKINTNQSFENAISESFAKNKKTVLLFDY